MSGQLFINVSPDTIYEHPNFAQRFVDLANSVGMPMDRCVIELTEESLLEDYDRLRSAMQRLREVGCAIAIDDLGAGSSGLRTWSELKPDYVKIDRYFVTGIDADATKLEFVRSMLDMGRAMGCRVIAEGVETERECRELVDLGLDRLQGHLFGRPSANPVAALQQVESLDRSIVTYTALLAEHISNYVQPVPPDMRVTEVADLFRDHPEQLTFPVVEEGKPLGVVRRERLFDLLAKPLHPEIFNKKPVTAVMESPTLLIDSQLRLEQVSRLVTQKSRPRLTEEFVITKDGRYHGLGQTIDVLRLITEQQLQSAKHSNPLTLLPGNAAVRSSIDKLIEVRKRFIVAYFDLDSFKPYNDVYGYAHGDQVILHLAGLLSSHFSARLDFVGHVGGDDFLVVMRSADWRDRVVNVLNRFSETVANFYSPEHALGQLHHRRRSRRPSAQISVADVVGGCVGFGNHRRNQRRCRRPSARAREEIRQTASRQQLRAPQRRPHRRPARQPAAAPRRTCCRWISELAPEGRSLADLSRSSLFRYSVSGLPAR